jgi:NAD(P)-dependent dehydrogenase (short-subunit alcohol dehydrogenase family)
MWALQAIGVTPSAAYSAGNAGVHALTRNLAIELASLNIRINTVAPTMVETPVYHAFMTEVFPWSLQPPSLASAQWISTLFR